jgi:hypothetical protein
LRSLTRIAAVLIVAVLLPYAVPPVYDFSDPQPFKGTHWWNPYQEVHGRWRRANFHAHGESWGGVTNGAQTDAQVVSSYWNAGYDIATVSDYQRIADAADTIPVYEHGYNVGKHHQLAIGARSVVWWDFPLWQGVNQKQFIIDRLRPSTELISLNHLSRLHSYTVDDMRRLTGYDLIEVANGRVATEDRWDAALSSGHPAFAIGGDDTHDVTDPNRMAIAWNMIDAETTTARDVIEALRGGRSYVVIRMVDAPANSDVALASLRTDDRSMTVTLSGEPAEISFVGQDGHVRQRTNGLSASYTFTPSDTYIRTNVHTTKSIVFLNPVMRSDADDHRPTMPALETDDLLTSLVRGGVVALCGLVVWLMV